jgi:serine/threonine-protein kinase
MSIVKVLDFGISKVALTGSAFDRQPMARTMMPMGSPVYMSPEQIRASEEVDGRTDIWSLGCVLYELLTGVPAFDAPSLTQLSATILEQDPVPMAQLAAEVPPELEAIVLRCLEKQPGQRFRNVAELAIALYQFGPRRARISAERCAQLLAESTGSQLELELPSFAPPPNPSLRNSPTEPSFSPTSTNSPTARLLGERHVEENPFRSKRHRVWIGASLALAAIIGAYAGAKRESDTGSDAPPTAKPVAAAPRIAAPPTPKVEDVVPAAATQTAVTRPPTVSSTPSAVARTKTVSSASSAATQARRAAASHPKREGARPARDELDVGF